MFFLDDEYAGKIIPMMNCPRECSRLAEIEHPHQLAREKKGQLFTQTDGCFGNDDENSTGNQI
jgi:hypothetical protein